MTEEKLTIGKMIEIARPQFEKITAQMPEVHRLNYEAEQRFAIQHLQTNSYLMDAARAHPEFLQAAMCNLAGIGLSLNPAEHLAYLIPRNAKNSEGKWETHIYGEPGYQGLIRLATDAGSIEWAQAELVYSKDTYIPARAGDRPDHVYDPFTKDRGDIVGVYCVAKTRAGDFLTTQMSIDEVNEIRDKTEIFKKAKKDQKNPYGPWVDHPGEQTKKTVFRRGFKSWPRTDQSSIMAQAVQMSNENMGFAPIVHNPDLGEYTAKDKEYFDQLIEESNAIGMYVLQTTKGERTFTNLYHSFEKGTKGKFQKVVDDLLEKGKGQYLDYENMAADAKRDGDATELDRIKEEEVSQEVWELLDETTKEV